MKFLITILSFTLLVFHANADNTKDRTLHSKYIDNTVEGNYIVFKLNPKNAKISVDGKKLKSKSINGIYTYYLTPGEHYYKVEAPNYKDETGFISMFSQKIIKTIELKSVLAQISFQAETPNVDIVMDGNLIEIHSWNGELVAGYHYLQVSKPGYYTYTSIFRVCENETKEIKIPALKGKFGSLKINTNPIDISVYVDGKFVGNSPCVVKEVIKGDHIIEFKKDIFSKRKYFTLNEYETKLFNEDFEQNLTNSLSLKAKELFILGEKYYFGEKVSKNYIKASNYFFQAATLGYSEAQYLLGIMYLKGKGVVKDNTKAINWLKQSAEQGDVESQYLLGGIYQHGNGTRINANTAVYWYKKAAEQNLPSAQCDLAYMYENGKGVNQYYHEAVKWYRKAAEQGSSRGQYHYGLMYQYGKGVSQNINIAVYWYRKAAKQNNKLAKEKLKELGYYVE